MFEQVTFTANSVLGEPSAPYLLSAGKILLSLDASNSVTARVIDTSWVGSEQVLFIATDEGTVHSYSDTDAVSFSVLNDHTPLVSGIADQRIEQGQTFSSFVLDVFLTERDGEPVAWSVIGNTNLQVAINGSNQVTVSSRISIGQEPNRLCSQYRTIR